jgi:hypothetical protein
MQSVIDTKRSSLVEAEVQSAYDAMFPQGNRAFVPMVFQWASDCFTGKYRDYLPIDAHYHDLEHTLQGTLCMSRLLRRRHELDAKPALTQRLFELGIIAILMHDTGYLKKRTDVEGTGAKYTLTHVERSIHFAGELLAGHSFYPADIHAVQNMIRCTGINVKLDMIPFQSQAEQIVGYALGTSDLLGQMAATDYVDKLPILYSEFAEAARFNQGKMKAGGFFSSALDLMQKTPIFWDNYVKNKINREFLGLYKFLNDPYPDGPNAYIDQIEANIARLREKLKTGERMVG